MVVAVLLAASATEGWQLMPLVVVEALSPAALLVADLRVHLREWCAQRLLFADGRRRSWRRRWWWRQRRCFGFDWRCWWCWRHNNDVVVLHVILCILGRQRAGTDDDSSLSIMVDSVSSRCLDDAGGCSHHVSRGTGRRVAKGCWCTKLLTTRLWCTHKGEDGDASFVHSMR